jgi:hypothetical protein
LRAVTEPGTVIYADSGSGFNSNAYLNTDTDTDPNAGGYLNSDAHFDSNPDTDSNAGACFNSIDHPDIEPSITIANWLAAGDHARRIPYVQGGPGPGTGDTAPPGLLQRERG